MWISNKIRSNLGPETNQLQGCRSSCSVLPAIGCEICSLALNARVGI